MALENISQWNQSAGSKPAQVFLLENLPYNLYKIAEINSYTTTNRLA
jgi:hypothetical protein